MALTPHSDANPDVRTSASATSLTPVTTRDTRALGFLRAATPAALVAIVAVGLVTSRRPDAFTNPQFWAEDGKYWFADAYNLGLAAFLKSYQGYMLLLTRLVAAPTTSLSLSHAALLFNLVGLAIQVSPAVMFMSRRFEHLASPAPLRALLGLAYLLLPSFELNVTITNGQWHLVILAALVIVASPPERTVARVFDMGVILLAGLTGPFAVFLFPAAVVSAYLARERRRWYGALSMGLLLCLAVQGTAWRLGYRLPPAALGVSFRNAVTIMSDRVVLPGTFGEEGHTHVFASGSAHPLFFATLISVLAAGVVGGTLLRGSFQLRILILVLFGITGLSMIAPIGTGALPAWTLLATSDGGERYFFTAELAWFICLAWSVSRLPWGLARGLGATSMAIAFASGLLASWAYPPYVDLHPATYTAELRAATPGATILVPINPGWQMKLVRH